MGKQEFISDLIHYLIGFFRNQGFYHCIKVVVQSGVLTITLIQAHGLKHY